MLIKSLKDRIRSQFNVSVAEIGEHDKWQKALVAICAVGNDKGHLDSTLQSVSTFVDRVRDIQISDTETEFL